MTEKRITCNLATILSERGMTQVALAKMIGVNHNCIHTYCSGRSFPTSANVVAISKAVNATIAEIWPHYVEEKKALYHRRGETLRKTIAARKWPSRQPEYKADKHVKSELRKVRAYVPVDPDAPNAVPLADDAYNIGFRLMPANASSDDLESPRWCREHARALHKYLVDHCAWGCYRELRAIMAAENRMAEERAKVVAQGRE